MPFPRFGRIVQSFSMFSNLTANQSLWSGMRPSIFIFIFFSKSTLPAAFLKNAQVFTKTIISPKRYKVLLYKIYFEFQKES